MNNNHAHPTLLHGLYPEAISYYESLIAKKPELLVAYWYLGLALLLQGNELEAQTTWLFALETHEDIEESNPESQNHATADLVLQERITGLITVLEQEAIRQEECGNQKKAWLIRQHIHTLAPQYLENLAHTITLAFSLGIASSQILTDLDAVSALEAAIAHGDLNPQVPLQIVQAACEYVPQDSSLVVDLVGTLRPYIEPVELLKCLLDTAAKLTYTTNRPDIGINYLELCFEIDDQQPDVLVQLSSLYRELGNFDAALKTANHLLSTCKTNIDFIHSAGLMIQTLLRAGRYWSEVLLFTQEQSQYIDLLASSSSLLDRIQTYRILTATSFLSYIADDAQDNRQAQNKALSFCQRSIRNYEKDRYSRYAKQNQSRQSNNPSRPLKIGYLSHCLREHSVGWLARWPYTYHNRDQFEIHTYFITHRDHDLLQNWYENHSDQSHPFQRNVLDAADQINRDEIDILVDLDSLTLDLNLEILALKPAPIQVTWLGWDASGLPAIDYYLADSYVLPPAVQEYYSETLIRLPHTYLAVNGFEVGIPTISRKSLEIPNESTIYFSSQSNAKRNPHNISLQMKIVAEVPNSYFLIKGINRNIQYSLEYFENLAEEAGLNPDRLRFLEMFPSSPIHRANLGIADIVLDTYPYNGATTTLETLWMGVPLVTRVGQQFSARNSYTFMMNAGITEGIAWTDEEYVEWGIRLGTDEQLRKEVAWKLRQSRKSAPLWNGQQFTRDMEAAYRQMWERYCHS